MRLGFVFSLDAFVAFTLVMLTISTLIFVIGTPKSYYPSLEQAHQLAYDTLQVLSTASDMPITSPAYKSYLQQILSGSSTPKSVMFKVAGGSDSSPGTIPKGFGYRLETYNFVDESWNAPLYDAGTDCPASDRCGKSFTKLQASATTFVSIYVDPPITAESPYCYLRCSGYTPPGGTPPTVCNNVPCNVSIWNFWPGNHSIQLVRLTVYA